MSIVIAFFRQGKIGYCKQAICQPVPNELFKLLFKRRQAKTDSLEYNELVNANIIMCNQVAKPFYVDPWNVYCHLTG